MLRQCFIVLLLLSLAWVAMAQDVPDLPEITPGPEITFAQALKMADERNLSIQMSKVDLESAQASYKMAWSVLLPVAQGTLTATHADHEDTTNLAGNTVVTRQQNSLNGALSASVPLINAQSWLSVSTGKKSVEASELTTEITRQALLLGVAQSFYQALSFRSLIEVQQNLYESADHHFKIAQKKYVSGVGSKLEIIRAQTELVKIHQEMRKAHAALDNARDSLAILTGVEGLPMPVEENPGKDESLDDLQVSAQGDLETKADKQREDIKLGSALVEVNQQMLNGSWMQFLPTLSASWQLTYQFSSPGGFGDSDRSRWNALLTLSVPIYNQSRYADLDLKRAALKKAKIQEEDTKQKARLEVRTKHRNYLAALDELAAAREHANLAAETLTLAQLAYSTGTGTSLEVIDASRTNRQSEVTLAIARFGVQSAMLDLLRAIGEDMKSLGPNR